MKKRALILGLVVLLVMALLVGLAWPGPGTATAVKKKVGWNKGTLYVIDWTSGTDAAVSTEISALVGDSSVSGFLRYIQTVPGKNGDLATTLPDANYDIVLYDAYSYDVAGGNLANRSGTGAERLIPSSPIFLNGPLTLVISSASNEKAGRLLLLVE